MRSLSTLHAHRDLLLAWASRAVRARYQQSVLGVLWAIAQPAATVLIFTIIFTNFIPINTGGVHYALFSFVAMVPWTFFSNSLTDMVNSLVENMNLVTKVYFPREVLLLAVLLARAVDFIVAAAMLLVLMLYFQAPLFRVTWLYLPLIIAIQLALTLGLGLVGAALNVFYRDVKHLYELGLRLLLYASPVIYPISRVPEEWQPFYFLNPMAGVITAYRDVLLYDAPPSPYLGLSAWFSVLILALGYWFFKRVEFQFADVV
jgi:lipopolysaccharide transport system permease protein